MGLQLLEALTTMFASFFNWRTVNTEHQLESEILEDKTDLEKNIERLQRACIYAEKAIQIVETHSNFDKNVNKKHFDKNVKKFRKTKILKF